MIYKTYSFTISNAYYLYILIYISLNSLYASLENAMKQEELNVSLFYLHEVQKIDTLMQYQQEEIELLEV